MSVQLETRPAPPGSHQSPIDKLNKEYWSNTLSHLSRVLSRVSGMLSQYVGSRPPRISHWKGLNLSLRVARRVTRGLPAIWAAAAAGVWSAGEQSWADSSRTCLVSCWSRGKEVTRSQLNSDNEMITAISCHSAKLTLFTESCPGMQCGKLAQLANRWRMGNAHRA